MSEEEALSEDTNEEDIDGDGSAEMSGVNWDDFERELMCLDASSSMSTFSSSLAPSSYGIGEDGDNEEEKVDIGEDISKHRTNVLRRMQWLSERLLEMSSSWEPIVDAILDRRRNVMTSTMMKLQKEIDSIMEEKRVINFETTSYHNIIKRCEEQEAKLLAAIELPKKTQLTYLRRLRKCIGTRLNCIAHDNDSTLREVEEFEGIQDHLNRFLANRDRLLSFQEYTQSILDRHSSDSLPEEESSNLLDDVKRKQLLAEEKNLIETKKESSMTLEGRLNKAITFSRDKHSLLIERVFVLLEELEDVVRAGKDMQQKLIQFKRDLRPPHNGRMTLEAVEISLQHELNELNRFHNKLRGIEERRKIEKTFSEQLEENSKFENILKQYVENITFDRSVNDKKLLSNLFSEEKTFTEKKKTKLTLLMKTAVTQTKTCVAPFLDDLNSNHCTISLAAYRSLFNFLCKEKQCPDVSSLSDDRKSLVRILFVIESLLEEFATGDISQTSHYRRVYEKASVNRRKTYIETLTDPIEANSIKKDAIGILTVLLVSCENLMNRDLDHGSTSDPYVTLQLGVDGIVQKSRRVNNDLNPVYMQVFKLSWDGEEPLICHVFDADRGTFDDPLGSCTIDCSGFDFSKGRKMIIKGKSLNAPSGRISLEISFKLKHCVTKQETESRDEPVKKVIKGEKVEVEEVTTRPHLITDSHFIYKGKSTLLVLKRLVLVEDLAVALKELQDMAVSIIDEALKGVASFLLYERNDIDISHILSGILALCHISFLSTSRTIPTSSADRCSDSDLDSFSTQVYKLFICSASDAPNYLFGIKPNVLLSCLLDICKRHADNSSGILKSRVDILQNSFQAIQSRSSANDSKRRVSGFNEELTVYYDKIKAMTQISESISSISEHDESHHSEVLQQFTVFHAEKLVALERFFLDISHRSSDIEESHSMSDDYRSVRWSLPRTFREVISLVRHKGMPAFVIIAFFRRGVDGIVGSVDLVSRIKAGSSGTEDLQFMYFKPVSVPREARKFIPSPRRVVKTHDKIDTLASPREQSEEINRDIVVRLAGQLVDVATAAKRLLEDSQTIESFNESFYFLPDFCFQTNILLSKIISAAETLNLQSLIDFSKNLEPCFHKLAKCYDTVVEVAYEFLYPLRGNLSFLRAQLVKLNSQEADLRIEVFEALNEVDVLEKSVMLINEACKDKMHDVRAQPSAEVINLVLNPENDATGDLMFLVPYFTSLPAQQFKRREAVLIRTKKTTTAPFQAKSHVTGRRSIRLINKPKEVKKQELEEKKPLISDISSMKLEDIKIEGTNNPILRRKFPPINEVDYDDDCNDDDEDRLDRRVQLNQNGIISIDIASKHSSSENFEITIRPSVCYRKLSSTVILPYDEKNNFSSFMLRDTWKSEEKGSASRRQTNVKINFSSLRRAVASSIATKTDNMTLNRSTKQHGASYTSMSTNSPNVSTLTPYPPITSRLSPSAVELLSSSRFTFP